MQMKERNYPAVLEDYGGEIVMVGINYDAGKKVHSCVIENQEKVHNVTIEKQEEGPLRDRKEGKKVRCVIEK